MHSPVTRATTWGLKSIKNTALPRVAYNTTGSSGTGTAEQNKDLQQKIPVQPQRPHCSVALLGHHYDVETKFQVGLAGDPCQ